MNNNENKVAQGRKKAKKVEFMVTYFIKSEEKKFFAEIKRTAGILSKRDYQMFTLLRSSGIRVGTLVNLKLSTAVEALSSVDNYLTLPNEICKGKKGYRIFLHSRTKEALKGLIKIHKKMVSESEHLVLNKNGARLSERMVQIRMKGWLRLAGLDESATPHWWRHTKAMRIMQDSQSKNPTAIVKVALGHASLGTTEIYTKPSREDLEASLGA